MSLEHEEASGLPSGEKNIAHPATLIVTADAGVTPLIDTANDHYNAFLKQQIEAYKALRSGLLEHLRQDKDVNQEEAKEQAGNSENPTNHLATLAGKWAQAEVEVLSAAELIKRTRELRGTLPAEHAALLKVDGEAGGVSGELREALEAKREALKRKLHHLRLPSCISGPEVVQEARRLREVWALQLMAHLEAKGAGLDENNPPSSSLKFDPETVLLEADKWRDWQFIREHAAQADLSRLSREERVTVKLLWLRHIQQDARESFLEFTARNERLDGEADMSVHRSTAAVKKGYGAREMRQMERAQRLAATHAKRQEAAARTEFVREILETRRNILDRSPILAIQSASASLNQQQPINNATRAHKTALKAVASWHSALEREEQKRQERIAKERLKALKTGDEEAYRKLLDAQKDTRLTHLLQQTDEFLGKLTTSVLAQQHQVRMADKQVKLERSGHLQNDEDLAGDNDDNQETVALLDGEYYGTAHRIREEVTGQSEMLQGGTLKEYQLKGIQWMLSLYNNHLNGILADEMGLGKTIQTIGLLAYLMEKKHDNGPFLIVVPLSTMTNWVLEWARWAPGARTIAYRGTPGQRKAMAPLIKGGQEFNVCLTTYEYVLRDRSVLGKPSWSYLIIDEGHRMKNVSSRLSKILSSSAYRSRHRLILTGTPLQNNLPELWSLLNFILPRIFNSAKTFEEWFSAPFASMQPASSSQPHQQPNSVELSEEEKLLIIRRLHKVLRPFLLRRLKRDVEGDLPEKVERILKCPMSALQDLLYASLTKQTIHVDAAHSGKQPATSLIKRFNNALMQLRKICNHPWVFEEVHETFFSDPNCQSRANQESLIWRVAGKFEVLHRILPKLQATGHRCLIFFQMTAVMTIMETMLAGMGIAHLRLDGSTKAEDRTSLLNRFNAPDSPYHVFLLSTRAGGLGLNLQSADTVIIFDSDWNPHADLQAQDRAHRIGQTKEVRILRLVTVRSVEEYILERARFKLALDGTVIQAGRFDQKSTAEEREAMLRALLESRPRETSSHKKAESQPGKDHENNDEDEGEEEGDYLEDDTLNELLARTDTEMAVFQEMDRLRKEKNRKRKHENDSPLIVESELPASLTTQLSSRNLEQKQDDNGGTGIRQSRLKRPVSYDEQASDAAWLKALERQHQDDDDTKASAPPPKRLKLIIKQEKLGDQQDGLRDVPFSEHHWAAFIEALNGTEVLEMFHELPSRQDYPDYYDLIEEPIALAEMHSKARKGRYKTLADVAQDLHLMAANACTYNQPGSAVYEDATEIEQAGIEALLQSAGIDNQEDVAAEEEQQQDDEEEDDYYSEATEDEE